MISISTNDHSTLYYTRSIRKPTDAGFQLLSSILIVFGKRTTTKKARRREEELPVRLRTYRLILLSLLTVDHREFDITSIHLIYQVIDPIILIMIVDAFLLLFLLLRTRTRTTTQEQDEVK